MGKARIHVTVVIYLGWRRPLIWEVCDFCRLTGGRTRRMAYSRQQESRLRAAQPESTPWKERPHAIEEAECVPFSRGGREHFE